MLDLDPYGIGKLLGKNVDMCDGLIGKTWFVRSAESRGWIWNGDLPENKCKAIYDRIEREPKVRQPL